VDIGDSAGYLGVEKVMGMLNSTWDLIHSCWSCGWDSTVGDGVAMERSTLKNFAQIIVSKYLEFNVNVRLEHIMNGIVPRAGTAWRGLSPLCRLSSSLVTKCAFIGKTDVFAPALSDSDSKERPLSPLSRARAQSSSLLQATSRSGKPAVAFHSLTSYTKARCSHCSLS